MTIFEYAYIAEMNFFKNPLAECGYESFTTFYSDLTLAECVEGIKGVQDTIENVKTNWIDDYQYFTEFVMCFSWKCGEMEYRHKKNMRTPYNTPKEYLELYSKEFYKLQDFFLDHYKDNQEALSYYYKTTD